MLKVFGNFDRARINRASERDKLRRFSPAAQLRIRVQKKNMKKAFFLEINDTRAFCP